MARIYTVTRNRKAYVFRDDTRTEPWCLSSEIMALMRCDEFNARHPERAAEVVYLGDMAGKALPF